MSSDLEAAEQRLQRILNFVVRQEPGLSWAVGDTADGDTLLATDLADGWIPPGVDIPAGVRLLGPGHRAGSAMSMLGATRPAKSYTPGDRLDPAADPGPTTPSVQPRELPGIDQCGTELIEAIGRRASLPPFVHALAQAGAAGISVAEPEVDLLRVHLDITRQRLLTEYPGLADTSLGDCLLLGAVVGIVTGDLVSANYHFAWYRV